MMLFLRRNDAVVFGMVAFLLWLVSFSSRRFPSDLWFRILGIPVGKYGMVELPIRFVSGPPKGLHHGA